MMYASMWISVWRALITAMFRLFHTGITVRISPPAAACVNTNIWMSCWHQSLVHESGRSSEHTGRRRRRREAEYKWPRRKRKCGIQTKSWTALLRVQSNIKIVKSRGRWCGEAPLTSFLMHLLEQPCLYSLGIHAAASKHHQSPGCEP